MSRLRSKDELRQTVKEERARIRPHVLMMKSEDVMRRLKGLDEYRKARSVMTYVSLKDEVDTRSFLRDPEPNEEKTLLIPFIDEDRIKAARFTGIEHLAPGRYKILEPKEKREHDGHPDLVIVPGIAFDERGGRLGHGKAYYDAFLKDSPAVKVGLTFEDLLVHAVPAEDHDVPMDFVITEQRVIDCKRREKAGTEE